MPEHSAEPIVGVLGGMGPDATVDFVDRVLEHTPAQSDQDHIEMVIHNDPKIPDRNAAILGDGESPLPRLRRNARGLAERGADPLVMPCNTAHAYIEDLREAVTVEMLDMVERAATRVVELDPGGVGLLTTSTVNEVGLYHDRLGGTGVDVVDPMDWEVLMEVIYDVKRGNTAAAQSTLDEIVASMCDRGVSTVMVACTDLSTLSITDAVDVVDAQDVLARAVVDTVRQRTKRE